MGSVFFAATEHCSNGQCEHLISVVVPAAGGDAALIAVVNSKIAADAIVAAFNGLLANAERTG